MRKGIFIDITSVFDDHVIFAKFRLKRTNILAITDDNNADVEVSKRTDSLFKCFIHRNGRIHCLNVSFIETDGFIVLSSPSLNYT